MHEDFEPQDAQITRVVHEMAMLVRNSFGPMGAETLLFCPPEPPLLTSSGYTIFHYADMASNKSAKCHPIKTFIMQKIRSIYKEMGDGITQYVIVLDLILQEMQYQLPPSHGWSTEFQKVKAHILSISSSTFEARAIQTPVQFDSKTRLPSPEVRLAIDTISNFV